MTNPYDGLPDRNFWRRAVAAVEPHRLDPIGKAGFQIGPGDRVATAGSCFAQHIARALPRMGLTYLVTEHGAHLPEAEREERQFGLFSARYGNVYTPAQWLQLLKEAHGMRSPVDTAWQRPDGAWIDPFRPTIEPNGLAGPDDVARDRAAHMIAVRRLVAEADVLVFTLGLTEAWRSKEDGSVYPLAPGVVGGAFDPDAHEFVNFTAPETEAALAEAIALLRSINPQLRILLTVSPVPLIATFEDRNVLVSTAYSKAALRVAADAVCRRFSDIDYFPSFELITATPTAGLYFEDDMRSVGELGVAHVMRLFRQHYVEGIGIGIGMGEGGAGPAADTTPRAAVICDEEMIERLRSEALTASGTPQR